MCGNPPLPQLVVIAGRASEMKRNKHEKMKCRGCAFKSTYNNTYKRPTEEQCEDGCQPKYQACLKVVSTKSLSPQGIMN